MANENYRAAILFIAGIVSCSDSSTTPESWFEAAADTISIAGERLAIVHQDTSSSSPDNIRVRLTASVPLDEFGFRFGVTQTWASCVYEQMRSEYYAARTLGAGETREVGRPNLVYGGGFHGAASAAAIDVVRDGVRLGNVFAGQYTGTAISQTQNSAAMVYIDVSGRVQLSIVSVLEGTIDAAGAFSAFSSACKLPYLTRTSTPFGEPLLLAGRELTGTIIDSTFVATQGQPLYSTTRWTVRVTR